MRRTTAVALGLIVAFALPGGAWAKPTATDKSNAAKECRLERGTTKETKAAFAEKYGTNKNKKKKNAFGKCVSSKAAKDKRGVRPAQEADGG
jgi:hypothetical protein